MDAENPVAARNLDRYGAPPIPWARVRERLEAGISQAPGTGGADLVVEGKAVKVTDEATLQRIASAYAADGWPAAARDGALWAEYSAPSAGPPPWEVYKVAPATVFALGTAEPYGATRWRFQRGAP